MATRQSEIITKGTLNVSLYVDLIQDNSGTNPGDPLTALVFNSTGLVCYYIRPGALPVQITLVTQTVNGAHTDGGFVEVGSTMPGKYRLDIPDAVASTGVDGAQVMVSGYVDLVPHTVNIQLTDVDLRDGQNAGLVVLPGSGTLAVNPTLAAVTHTGTVIPTVSTVTDGAKDSTVAKDATVMKTTHINATAGVVNEVAALTGHTAQTADHTAAIADIPNNAEFNARTLAAADYFDHTTDTVSANMTQINSNVQAAVNLALSAGRITPFTVTDAAFTPTPNIFEVSTFSEATPDHHKSRIILWTTGALAADGGQITNIEASSLEAGNVRFTVTTMTEAPANGDTGILM
jgi:hypothetical protein